MLLVILLDSLKRDGKLCLEICEKIKNYYYKKNHKLEIKIVQTGSDLTRIVLSRRKSMMIHNFARSSNSNHLERLKKLHVKNFILDTENVCLWMFSKTGLVTSKLLKNVDVFFTWGSSQKKQLEKLNTKTRIIQCGSYRHQKIITRNYKFDNKILILTSAPVANPKFTTKSQAFSEAKRSTRLSHKNVTISSNEQLKLANRICKLVPYLSKIFKEIVFRVHPFENEAIYLESASKFKNITFSKNKFLEDDLKNCSTVLHGYSNAGIESVLYGNKTYVVKYSKNLPKFLREYYELLKTGSTAIDTEDLNNKNFFKVQNSLISQSAKEKIINFYGINETWQKGIQIITESIINESKLTFNLNFYIIFKRLLALYLLYLRKIIGKAPKPKISKLISTDDLKKIIRQEKLNLKIRELGINSGIWEIV